MQELKNGLKIALVGNPNSGKTTLFNRLTGENRRVGNYPGVTVEKRCSALKNDENTLLLDLPGAYSLSPYSEEERITQKALLEDGVDGIINIVDVGNLTRSLYLTLQLLELRLPTVLAVNMLDELRESGGKIDLVGLSNALQIPVVGICAKTGENNAELIKTMQNTLRSPQPKRTFFADYPLLYNAKTGISALIEEKCVDVNLPVSFTAWKVLEKEQGILEKLRLSADEHLVVEQILKKLETDGNTDGETTLATARFEIAETFAERYLQKPKKDLAFARSEKIDRILTGKYTAFPLFVLIMAGIFYLTFGPIGQFFQDCATWLIERVFETLLKGVSALGANEVTLSLLSDGVFAGIGGVLGFLPTILLLFFCLSVLEDTGYMARVAFILDRPLQRIGLSGKSFVPMLLGFGCSVLGVMATRTLSSERERKVTAVLTPYMSCSAKIPVYGMLAVAFFGNFAPLVVFGLYVIGIIFAVFVAWILHKIRGECVPAPFILELPNYRMPTLKSVSRLVFEKAKDFVVRAFTLIFLASVAIWFLQSFDLQFRFTQDSKESLLAWISGAIAVMFEPIGLGDWRIVTALFCGIMAKESVKSVLDVLIGVSLQSVFSPFSALLFLLFFLLYTPCVATLAVLRREFSGKFAGAVLFGQCFFAWLVCLIVKILFGGFV